MRLGDLDRIAQDVRENNTGNYDKRDWTSRLVVTLLESAPIIDAVHAAGGCYCRECSYRLPKGTVCQLSGTEITGDDFCSRGQSKGGDHE